MKGVNEVSDLQRTVTVIPANPQMMQETVKRQLRVAAYCRVSTEEEEQQSSYEAQCSYYTDKIMTNPEWTMAGIFADEGITGTSTKKRDDFNRMIRRCRQKKIDLILTKSISRFARNTLDCLRYVRALKELGIGVYFEKENINTMDMDTELILTFMGAFAQSESESISANVKWGIRQAMKEGKVHINFNRLFGYYVKEDGSPDIDPAKAESVRYIYDRYLLGDSLREIKQGLELRGQMAPNGSERWDISEIRRILANEKYAGDALLQKTFKPDVLSGKVQKNTGQLPMYLVQNNHPAIIDRDRFNAVQAERERRNARKSPSQKTSSTGRSCYASKYALSERLVCGECGTLYRRCTWKRNGKTKIVWRCVNRLDYGTQYCHDSPSMEENRLQQAIMKALNSVMGTKHERTEQIKDAMIQELFTASGEQTSLGDLNRRIQEREAEFSELLDKAPDENMEDYMERFRAIKNELATLKEKREIISAQLRNNRTAQMKIWNTSMVLEKSNHHMTEWDEDDIRQLVHTVKVISEDCIKVILTDGTEINQEVHKQ